MYQGAIKLEQPKIFWWRGSPMRNWLSRWTPKHLMLHFRIVLRFVKFGLFWAKMLQKRKNVYCFRNIKLILLSLLLWKKLFFRKLTSVCSLLTIFGTNLQRKMAISWKNYHKNSKIKKIHPQKARKTPILHLYPS